MRENVGSPLLEVDMSGSIFRYFRSPIYQNTREPDMPWHVFNDLVEALGLDEDAASFLLRRLRENWPEPKTIASTSGLVTIAPHFMAEGFLKAVGRSRRFRPDNFLSIRGCYRRNLTQALHKILPHYNAMHRLYFALNCMDS